MSQLELFAFSFKAALAQRDPYRPFDAIAARGIILARLKLCAGGWVRHRALSRATGMRPAFVRRLLSELCTDGLIECTETLPIVHPMHGYMGQTTGYRVRQKLQVAA